MPSPDERRPGTGQSLLRGLGRALRRLTGRRERVADPLSSPVHAALAPLLREKRQWQTEQRQAPDHSELYRIFRQSPGANKWVQYFDAYEQAFAPYRDKPITFLEIGVHRGGSLRMWKQYFHPDSRIVGIDIVAECAAYETRSENIFVRIGEQQNEKFLRALIDEFGPFDIVLDDGSHMASHALKSFNVLFTAGMTDRSVYVVEDLHTGYHPGFVDELPPFQDVVKHLVDVMHAHYFRMHHLPRGAFSRPEPVSLTVPAITTVLDQIQIFDSIVVLHRNANRQTPFSERVKGKDSKPAVSRAS